MNPDLPVFEKADFGFLKLRFSFVSNKTSKTRRCKSLEPGQTVVRTFSKLNTNYVKIDFIQTHVLFANRTVELFNSFTNGKKKKINKGFVFEI